MSTPLRKIANIKFDVLPNEDQKLDELLDRAIELARDIIALDNITSRSGRVQIAAGASILVVNSLISAMAAQCTLAAPAADITMRTDGSGNLIYRCSHSPSHEWKVNATRVK